MTNIQVSQKELETYLRIKKLIEEGYEYEDLVLPTCGSLIIPSEEMKPGEYDSLSDTASDSGVSRQTLSYAHKHKKPLINRRKGGAKVFFIE